MGTEGESFEVPFKTHWEPCTSRQGQSQHHQGGEGGSAGLLLRFSIPSPLLFVILNKFMFYLDFFCELLQVFSDQLLLQDVLTRSDRALAVVKDLFGDAPRRQMGKIVIHSSIIDKKVKL